MKNNKLINSFKYAFTGIFSALKNERNMKIHFVMMLLVIIIGIWFKISTLEWIICIGCFGVVIGAEMFNTAIEVAIDIAMPEKNEKAKIAKDVSAGAVLIFAIASAVIGIIIFAPKVIWLFK